MSVYVDKAANSFGRMIMSHMIADTPQELRDMADLIGVQRKWFQSHGSTPHFDIAKSKRAAAIAHGAIELDMRPYVEAMRRIRATWPTTPTGDWIL